MKLHKHLLGMAAVSLLTLAACGGSKQKTDEGTTAGSGEATQSAAVTAADRAEADQIFNTRCSVCHGPTGHGDGPGAASLTPKPRNYHDKAWQDSVSNDEIEKAIVYGGAAVGRSPMMVGNPDLGSKPGVVAALREKIRDFGKQP